MEKNLRVQAVAGGTGKTIAGRLLPGTDLLDGLEEACRQHNVKYAAIVSVIGSLSKTKFAIPVRSEENKKVGIVYAEPTVLEGPIELLSAQGVICQSEDGKYLTHLHGSISDEEMRVWGGHFFNGGNITLATVDFVICEVTDVKLMRRYDEETGFVQFSPEKMEG